MNIQTRVLTVIRVEIEIGRLRSISREAIGARRFYDRSIRRRRKFDVTSGQKNEYSNKTSIGRDRTATIDFARSDRSTTILRSIDPATSKIWCDVWQKLDVQTTATIDGEAIGNTEIICEPPRSQDHSRSSGESSAKRDRAREDRDESVERFRRPALLHRHKGGKICVTYPGGPCYVHLTVLANVISSFPLETKLWNERTNRNAFLKKTNFI